MPSRKLSPWYASRLCIISLSSHLWRILTRHGTTYLQSRRRKHHQDRHFLGGRGLTFQKRKPEARFLGASGKVFMLIFVLPDSNNKKCINRKIQHVAMLSHCIITKTYLNLPLNQILATSLTAGNFFNEFTIFFTSRVS